MGNPQAIEGQKNNPQHSQQWRDKLITTRQRADRLSRLLDESFSVPLIKLRLGWDAIIGVVPVFGDLLGALISVTFVWQAWRVKAPFGLLVRMSLNILVEILVGAVPVLGDLFDVFWKANRKNYQLLAAHINHELEGDGELGVNSAGNNGETVVLDEYDWTAPLLSLVAILIMGAAWYFYGDAIDEYWSNLVVAMMG